MIEFFYPPSDFQKELLKLTLQFGGAMFIAWKTVHWALGRFKSEKMWEHQTSALADVLVAIREMEVINNVWLEDEYRGRLYNDDDSSKTADDRNARYMAARRRLREVSAVAAIVLQNSITEAIRELEAALSADNHDTFLEECEHDGAALKKAREKLIILGKSISS